MKSGRRCEAEDQVLCVTQGLRNVWSWLKYEKVKTMAPLLSWGWVFISLINHSLLYIQKHTHNHIEHTVQTHQQQLWKSLKHSCFSRILNAGLLSYFSKGTECWRISLRSVPQCHSLTGCSWCLHFSLHIPSQHLETVKQSQCSCAAIRLQGEIHLLHWRFLLPPSCWTPVLLLRFFSLHYRTFLELHFTLSTVRHTI